METEEPKTNFFLSKQFLIISSPKQTEWLFFLQQSITKHSWNLSMHKSKGFNSLPQNLLEPEHLPLSGLRFRFLQSSKTLYRPIVWCVTNSVFQTSGEHNPANMHEQVPKEQDLLVKSSFPLTSMVLHH